MINQQIQRFDHQVWLHW